MFFVWNFFPCKLSTAEMLSVLMMNFLEVFVKVEIKNGGAVS